MKKIETSIKKIFKDESKLDSTYSNDLDRELIIINKKNPSFVNSKVIMKDMVSSLKVYDKMFFIVNYDNSDKSGSHWVAVIKNNQFVYYFDSYGLRPLEEIKDKFKRDNRIFYNDTAVQLNNSKICGQLCLYFIKKMVNETEFRVVMNDMYLYSNRYRIDK